MRAGTLAVLQELRHEFLVTTIRREAKGLRGSLAPRLENGYAAAPVPPSLTYCKYREKKGTRPEESTQTSAPSRALHLECSTSTNSATSTNAGEFATPGIDDRAFLRGARFHENSR